MKAFVIYDETGSVYAVRYGENKHIPNELKGIYEEVPDGALIEGVDISNPEDPKILLTPPKESALEKELKELRAQIEYMSMMSGFDVEEV